MYKLTAVMNDNGEQVEVELADQGDVEMIVAQVKNPDDAEIVRIDSDVPGLAEWLTRVTEGADIWLLAEYADTFDHIYGPRLATDPDFVNAVGLVLEHQEEVGDVENALMMLDSLDYGSECIYDVLDVLGFPYGLDALESGGFVYCDGVVDDEALGKYLVEQAGGVADVSSFELYLDMVELGKELADDAELDEHEVKANYGSIENFAEEMIEQNLVSEYQLDYYFDYEQYGADCYSDFTGGYGTYGFVYVP